MKSSNKVVQYINSKKKNSGFENSIRFLTRKKEIGNWRHK